MKRNIKQGEIYMVNLGENNVGSEEKGVRPCVIISAEMLNKNRNNVIVIPITSSTTKKDMINHYELQKENYDFSHSSSIMFINSGVWSNICIFSSSSNK